MNRPMDSKRPWIGLLLSLNALNPLGILVARFMGSRREVGLGGILTPGRGEGKGNARAAPAARSTAATPEGDERL